MSSAELAGFFYRLITVPLTDLVNTIDNRLRGGRRLMPQSGLIEVGEVAGPADGLWRDGGSEGHRSESRTGQRDPHHRVVGSGKSRLLRCLNRLVETAAGDILPGDSAIVALRPERLRARVGMVFQQFNLFPDHTALESAALALTRITSPKAGRQQGSSTGQTPQAAGKSAAMMSGVGATGPWRNVATTG